MIPNEVQELKVRNEPHLVRKRDSKAIINKDTKGLNKYREEREKLQRIKQVVDENENLKREVKDLKNSLDKLTNLIENFIRSSA